MMTPQNLIWFTIHAIAIVCGFNFVLYAFTGLHMNSAPSNDSQSAAIVMVHIFSIAASALRTVHKSGK